MTRGRGSGRRGRAGASRARGSRGRAQAEDANSTPGTSSTKPENPGRHRIIANQESLESIGDDPVPVPSLRGSFVNLSADIQPPWNQLVESFYRIVVRHPDDFDKHLRVYWEKGGITLQNVIDFVKLKEFEGIPNPNTPDYINLTDKRSNQDLPNSLAHEDLPAPDFLNMPLLEPEVSVNQSNNVECLSDASGASPMSTAMLNPKVFLERCDEKLKKAKQVGHGTSTVRAMVHFSKLGGSDDDFDSVAKELAANMASQVRAEQEEENNPQTDYNSEDEPAPEDPFGTEEKSPAHASATLVSQNKDDFLKTLNLVRSAATANANPDDFGCADTDSDDDDIESVRPKRISTNKRRVYSSTSSNGSGSVSSSSSSSSSDNDEPPKPRKIAVPKENSQNQPSTKTGTSLVSRSQEPNLSESSISQSPSPKNGTSLCGKSPEHSLSDSSLSALTLKPILIGEDNGNRNSNMISADRSNSKNPESGHSDSSVSSDEQITPRPIRVNQPLPKKAKVDQSRKRRRSDSSEDILEASPEQNTEKPAKIKGKMVSVTRGVKSTGRPGDRHIYVPDPKKNTLKKTKKGRKDFEQQKKVAFNHPENPEPIASSSSQAAARDAALSTKTKSGKKNATRKSGSKNAHKSSLKDSDNSDHGDNTCKCSECGQTFQQLSSLSRHLKEVHGFGDDNSKSKKKKFPCDFPGCKSEFTRKPDLTVHQKTIHAKNSKKFACPLCSLRTFKHERAVKDHLRRSCPIKKYQDSKRKEDDNPEDKKTGEESSNESSD